MERITDVHAMRRWAEECRAGGRRLAFVPTMGALHDGHLALVTRAAALGDRVVVSIFVNPMQFERRDDFDAYPTDLAADAALLEQAGVAALFVPDAGAMYPPGFQTRVEVERLTAPLCGGSRPGHFRGVTTVVTKLFHIVRPHVAVFGEKDYQQLITIRRMVRDLDFGIEIVGVPTVRERDGLALSSRNRRLDAGARAAARCVPRALRAAVDAAAAGERAAPRILEAVRREIAAEPLARLEYAELRDPDTLEEIAVLTGAARLAVAVWVDAVRLIDNCAIDVRPATAHAENTGSRSETVDGDAGREAPGGMGGSVNRGMNGSGNANGNVRPAAASDGRPHADVTTGGSST
jgi:pantoate--beta-alanine ligase